MIKFWLAQYAVKAILFIAFLVAYAIFGLLLYWAEHKK